MASKIRQTTMDLKKVLALGGMVLGLALISTLIPQYAKTSDHDDGEVDTKGRNRNLTDLFVFRERDQNSNAASENLIFVMNTNPRSLAGQQYYFSTNARYEFKVTHRSQKNRNQIS